MAASCPLTTWAMAHLQTPSHLDSIYIFMAQTWPERERWEFKARLCPKETDDNKELFLEATFASNLPILFALNVCWSVLLLERRA